MIQLYLAKITIILKKLEAFGGEGKQLHFAHANAYPVKTYYHFLDLFTDDFEVYGMHQRPCWDNSDVNNFVQWEQLADDMIQVFDEHDMKNVIAMGHSMGGVATLYAANKRPDLFSAIVLIDPVIMDKDMLDMMNQMPFEQQVANNPMAQIAIKRRNTWKNEDEALSYFESKTFFQAFTTEAKKHFIAHGLKSSNGHLTLSYPREWEARVYSIVPNVWEELVKITCPSLIVKAEKSDVIRTEKHWNMIKEVASSTTCIELADAGHLIPQEKPVELKETIMDFLNTSIDEKS
jgi:pimeloyl-ACP methyl ester carboxylesterase